MSIETIKWIAIVVMVVVTVALIIFKLTDRGRGILNGAENTKIVVTILLLMGTAFLCLLLILCTSGQYRL